MSLVSVGFDPDADRGRGTVDVPGAHGAIIKRVNTPAYTRYGISTRVGASIRGDGGLELPPKVVQERLGHSSIMMTLDVYGHLFPRHDDTEELAAAEKSLLA